MRVGKFVGLRVDQLPNSYLRWMMTQSFPQEYMEAAKAKLERSQFNNDTVNITRHALDMLSLRCLTRWTDSCIGVPRPEGVATFFAKLARKAFHEGKDVSKRRHVNDGIIKEYEGLRWVFGQNPSYPEYIDVITVTGVEEKQTQANH